MFCRQARIRRGRSLIASTQKYSMKKFPTKCERQLYSDDGRFASGRRVGEVELGRHVAEHSVDVQLVDEVPHRSNDGLHICGGGSALRRARQSRLVVDEGQEAAISKMFLKYVKGRPDGDDLEGEDLGLSSVEGAMEMSWDVSSDPNGGGGRDQHCPEAR